MFLSYLSECHGACWIWNRKCIVKAMRVLLSKKMLLRYSLWERNWRSFFFVCVCDHVSFPFSTLFLPLGLSSSKNSFLSFPLILSPPPTLSPCHKGGDTHILFFFFHSIHSSLSPSRFLSPSRYKIFSPVMSIDRNSPDTFFFTNFCFILSLSPIYYFPEW